ncbi:MAG: lytic transglycosylase domain-containing protein [Acidobacteriia bacterium]|nr:lytic transglycosylase domain-containing protein [Terriglobia bacterium]MYG01704.1 lytic transglycosylase domain-containing protein [Terriglobia bacterium]MYK08228.1 lytic transglycosylase domain-containing protein [Terriglobia bacterium]
MQQPLAWRLLTSLLIAWAVCTADTVVLRSGYRLSVQGHEASDGKIRLLMPNGGWIAVLEADVERIEPEIPQPRPQTPVIRGDPASDESDALERAITLFSAEAGLPPGLVRAVVWAESDFQQGAISPKGAIGLMQLMPETAAELGVNPRDSEQNLQGGTTYLRQMLDRFEGDPEQLLKALAAYNAGLGQVARHGGIPPFPETAAYVRRVVRRYLADGKNPPGADAEKALPADQDRGAPPED